MPNDVNLTGSWAGEYYQYNRPNPIAAEFVHEAGRLTGSMTDAVTDQSSTVFQIASEAGLPPGSDERIEAMLRELLPDKAQAPITYISHLPSESVVEGQAVGSRVDFVKSYRGEAFGGYKVGDQLVIQQVDGHRVHYRGKVGPDGLEIEGQWWIDPVPGLGAPRAEGSFRLRRLDAGRS